MTNKRCWKCGWVRGGEQLPDDQSIVSGADDLFAFVRRCLDEDEARTRKLLADAQRTTLTLQDPRLLGKFIPGWHDWPDVEQMCTERLAEVEAKRRILDDHDILVSAIRRVDDVEGNRLLHARREARESDIRWLAQPYAGQDGWREEWRA
jgi:hypothetical protein